MTTWLTTRHWSEDGPIEGYVYLAVRNKTDYSVKIGSTRLLPAQRLCDTPSCDKSQFLVACRTEAARELEHALHVTLVKKGLRPKGRDSFDLRVEHVLALAMWFNGGTYRPDQDTEPHSLALVDIYGNLPASAIEFGRLLGRAARLAIAAENKRSTLTDFD